MIVIRYGSMPTPLRELKCVVRTMDRGGACGFHLVPYSDDPFYFGASSGVWTEPEPQPRAHAVSWLLHGIETEFSNAFFTANVTLRAPGYRPVAADTSPLLGESKLTGIWFASERKRDGCTYASYLTREMAKAMAGGPGEQPEMFRPSRPLISYWNRDRATVPAVRATIGGEHMHGLDHARAVNRPSLRSSQAGPCSRCTSRSWARAQLKDDIVWKAYSLTVRRSPSSATL